MGGRLGAVQRGAPSVTADVSPSAWTNAHTHVRIPTPTHTHTHAPPPHHSHTQMTNQATHEMFGWSKAELRGKNVNIIIPPPYNEHHAAYVRNFIQTGKLSND